MKKLKHTKSSRELLAENLKRLREHQELSQEALAGMAGFHRTYVSQLEKCRANVSLDNLDKLASVLGLTAPQLIEGEAAGSSAGTSSRELLAENLKRLREHQELSQEALAAMAGFHRGYVSELEKCRANVALDNLDKLANCFGLRGAQLIGDEAAAGGAGKS